MNQHCFFALAILAIILTPAVSKADLPADDFNDNTQGPMWFLFEQDSNNCQLDETNQRLELRATTNADDLVSAYVSNGWLLNTTNDFQLKVDFHYSGISWGDGWIMFLLTPTLADDVDRHVAIRVGCDEESPYFWYEATDGPWRDEGWGTRDVDDGTLYISYNSLTDRLYLSYTDYGRINSWVTMSDLIQDRWGGGPVYVAIGGGSVYAELQSGEAYMDNFVVDEGTVVDPISDHVSGVHIGHRWDYDDPYDNTDLTYEFDLQVSTDDTVELVEFKTPGGNTFQIPNQPYTQSGYIETRRYFQDGAYQWWYGGDFVNSLDLQEYGDGWYTVRVYYAGGGQGQTSVWFGMPDKVNPIPQPTQEPYLTYPQHRSGVDSPVTFTWWWCWDSAATEIWMSLEKEETGEEIENSFDVSETSWGPVELTDGFWGAEISFGQSYYTADNGDGIGVHVAKNSESDYEFAVGGFDISGRVTDKYTLEGLGNIRVGCWQKDFEIWNQTYTDINGFYTLTNIQPGQVEVRAEPEAIYAGMGTEFELTENVYGLDFALSPEAVLSGKVIDAMTAEPLEGIEVTYWCDRYEFGKNDFSDSDGAFSLTNLPTGMAEIKARPGVESGYAWSLPWGSSYIYLAEGEHLSNRIIALHKGALVSGYIKDANGIPIGGIEYDWNGKLSEGWGRADSEGRYQIRLPEGTYVIGPDEEDFGVLRKRVTITDINQPVEVNDITVYTEETGGQISGNVNNPSGYPKTGEFLIAAFETGSAVDPNTWYTISVLGETGLSEAGAFSISALPPDVNYDVYLCAIRENPDDMMSFSVRDSVINVSAGTTDINLYYNSEGSTVRGKLENTNGRALVGLTVLINDPCTGAFRGFGETDPNGEYFIYNVGAGTYTFTAIHSKYTDVSTTIEVVDGVPADAGTVVMPFGGEKEGADLNGNGIVNMVDFAKFGSEWRQSGSLDADFDQNGEVGFTDLARVAENWLWQAIWLH